MQNFAKFSVHPSVIRWEIDGRVLWSNLEIEPRKVTQGGIPFQRTCFIYYFHPTHIFHRWCLLSEFIKSIPLSKGTLFLI